MRLATDPPEETPRLRLFDRRPTRVALLVLLCLALIIRGRVILSLGRTLNNDPDAYRSAAWHVYLEHTLGVWQEPFNRMTPTAARPPLYPLLLSAPFFVLRSWDTHGPLVGLLHVLLGTMSVWVVWRLALAWGLPPAAGLVAAGLFTLDPILINQSVQLMTETLATLLALLALWALTACGRERSLRAPALAGTLLGLCVLCRPTFLPWLIGVVLVMLPLRSGGTRRFLRAGVLVAAAAAVLAPWAMRNYHLFGRPIITTTHGGFTLLLANNPEFYEYLRSAPWGSIWNGEALYRSWENGQTLINTPEGPALDEIGADRRAYREAWQNIEREPGMFAYACLVRVGRLWGVLPHQVAPDETTASRVLRYAIAVWYVVELSLAAIGAWSLGRRLLSVPWIWGTLLIASFTAVHALYWTDLRMRAPLSGVIVLLAAAGIAALALRGRAQHLVAVEVNGPLPAANLP